jgi:hypothetical protein
MVCWVSRVWPGSKDAWVEREERSGDLMEGRVKAGWRGCAKRG